MKLHYLMALTAFFLIGCGETTPSNEVLSKNFNEQYNDLQLESIELKKTEGEGDFTAYAATGKFIATKNAYEQLGVTSLFSNEAEFYKRVQKSGDKFDFTSTVIVEGNEKSGWNIDFRALKSELPTVKSSEETIKIDDPKVFVVNAENFKSKIENIPNAVKELEAKIAENSKSIEEISKQSASNIEKKDYYWQNLEIDGKKFSGRAAVKEYLLSTENGEEKFKAYNDEFDQLSGSVWTFSQQTLELEKESRKLKNDIEQLSKVKDYVIKQGYLNAQ